MATPTPLPADFNPGQILTAGAMDGLRGAFRILQVVNASTTTQFVTSTSTYATIGLSASITPQSTSSKILVLAHIGGVNKQVSNTGLNLTLYKNGVGLSFFGARVGFDSTANEANADASCLFLDSPNTVASTTYAIFGASSANASFALAQHQNANSTIILCEVSA
jgi:hypothetical protein